MSGSGEQVTAGATSAPLASTPVVLGDALVADVLLRLAGAAGSAAACDAVLPLLLDVPGVRAAAVVLRDGHRALVVGSAGYGCGPMSPGAELPLDAGLPVTEAVRTGRTVVQGSGPGWVAEPFAGRAGALLLSLTTAPPEAPVELQALQRLARGLGDALARAGRQEHAVAELAAVSAVLTPPAPPAGIQVRSLPHDGAVGGDLALCLPDGRGGRWLVVGDVCGSGLPAAVLARSVQATFTALAPYVSGPDALLGAADRALRAYVGEGLFVTALAVHEQGGRLRAASAGHPPLLVVTPDGAAAVGVEPGLPLALDGHGPSTRPEVRLEVPDGAVLLLHSDGLADRQSAAGPCDADVPSLVAGGPLDDLAALAEHVLARAEEVGAQDDDVTLLLARSRR